MIEQKSYLNLIPDTGPLNVHCSQYDAGIRTLVFGLYKGASLFQIPEGMTAKIRGAKPDGNVFEYSMTVDAEANTVSVTITEQMSVIAGDVICEVVLFNGATDSAANVIGSANFTLIVEPSPIDMGVFSDSDVPAIETLINGGEIGQIMTWKETGAAWTWVGQGDMKKSVYDTNDDGVVDNAEKVNGKTVARDVAADEYTNAQIDNKLSNKVDKETGKGLSTEDYTTAEKTKLGALPTADELTAGLANKVDKEAGKGLSSNDYTTAEKEKLAGIEAGAQVNTVTGVKGDSEAEYRTGNINITPANIGLGNVDNTSDLDKPVSTAAQTALDGKVDKVSGKGLSTEDYTTAEKTKLGALPDAATLNADLASKADDSVVVKSVNTKTPTNGAVEVTAEDIPADGIGDKSVSGNPIVIEDGMASVAKELSVTLEPIQDLHGYESPWIGTDVDKQPYLFRAVSESSVQDKGTHEMDKLIGGTVAWNQYLRNGNFADSSYWSPQNSSLSISDGVATFTASQQDGGIYSNTGQKILGHRYLEFVDLKGTSAFSASVLYSWGQESSKIINITTAWQTFYQFMTCVATSTGNMMMLRDHRASGWDALYVRKAMVIDLTQMFGSTIADYIYSLEQSTAGAGVSFFRKLFPAPFYPYNAGELMSVKTSAHITRGFNQWDGTYEAGKWLASPDGTVDTQTGYNLSGFIRVIPGTLYYKLKNDSGRNLYYDADKNIIPNQAWNTIPSTETIITIPQNAHYVRFTITNEYLSTFCINISKTTGTPKNGDYVAYDGHSYPLDSDLELRGIPKLDSNNKLYYDGDVYEASGNVQRKYGIVDLGTLTWSTLGNYNGVHYGLISNSKALFDGIINGFVKINGSYVDLTDGAKEWSSLGGSGKVVWIKDSSKTAAEVKTAMSGVYLVYELETPTSETADPYTSTQVIDPDGTEEYVDTRTVAIPVGHESNYANICPIEGRTGTEVTRSDGAETDPDTDTASVTFGQTVYGGQVDFVSGKCRVTYGIVDLSTLANWTTSGTATADGTPCKYTSVSGMDTSTAVTGMIAEKYANISEPYIMYMTNGTMIRGGGRIYVATSDTPSGNLCYLLATPIELTLTPAQLSLLEGTNILTADGTINLTYLGSMASNVQDEIDEFESGLNNVIGSIAFIENSTAKTSHAVGDYVILNGIFCKVIASISAGETLSFGTNIRATTIGAELRAIWTELNA